MPANSQPLSPTPERRVPPIELREIDINVTNLCNLECIYCSYASGPSQVGSALSAERVHSLLEEAAALNTRAIHFSGGEPTSRPDIEDLVAHASSLKFSLRLLSNGALLSPEKLERLWEAGLRKLLVSLDGSEADHNLHRANPKLYPKTTHCIQSAIAMGYNVRINAVATTLNVDRIPALIPLAADWGAATLSVFYLIPLGRGRNHRHLMVPPPRWRRLIEDMRLAAQTHSLKNMEVSVEKVFAWQDEWASSELSQGRGGTCLGFLDKCNYVLILADGRVYPCVCFIDEAPPLGNIRERSLADILHDPAAWDFYWNLLPLNPTCRHCELAMRCRGGNRALSQIVSQDWFALDPRCSGKPAAQGYYPLCFMQRENIATSASSGFAEHVPKI